MTTLPSCTLACAVFAGIALFLQGCAPGGGTTTPAPPPPPPSPPPPSGPCKDVPNCNQCADGTSCTECNEGFQKVGQPTQCMYACTSSETFPIVQAEKKGLCLDDTTFRYCPDKVHSQWANTKNAMVGSIRTTKAWESDWPMSKKEAAWDSLATYLHATGAKALVGTTISCDETSDDADWKDTMALLKKLGPQSVMGVAVGNELALLNTQKETAKGTFPSIHACSVNMWADGGYLQTKMISRIADLDALGSDWTTIKVTTVLGATILGGHPFINTPVARATTFFKNILKHFKSRYVFSFNVYPYFDGGNHFDPAARTCKQAIAQSTCFDKTTCLMQRIIADARHRMAQFDSMYPGLDMKDLEFWLTETGWSSPTASTLIGANENMAQCAEFSSLDTMTDYYKNFLNWDMKVQGVKGPDHAFFFTMRDSLNFGSLEHFGLGGSGDPTKLCQNSTCKLQHGSGASRSFVV